MPIRILSALAVMFFFTAVSVSSAQAVPITLGGDQYEVSTVVGTYNDLQPDLSDTPWFSSIGLAESAAVQAALSPNVFFAFDAGGALGTSYLFFSGVNVVAFFNREVFDPSFFTTQNTFAVASLVPPPTAMSAPNSFLLLGLGGMVLIAGRLRRA